MAVMLWGYVSLTRTYEDYVDVTLTVVSPADQALLSAIPSKISIRTRGSGWRLFNLRLFPNTAACDLNLSRLRPDANATYNVGKSDIMRAIQLPQAVQALDVEPSALTLVVGERSARLVPVVMRYRIDPRPGFVVGTPRVSPAEIELRGSAQTLQPLNSWPTQRLVILDAIEDIDVVVPVSDSLASQKSAEPAFVRVQASVQQFADRILVDIPIVVPQHASGRLSTVEPSIITVVLQGGADDLAAIKPSDIKVTVSNPRNGTNGLVRPIVSTPSSVRLLGTKPEVVYVTDRRIR